MPRPKYRHVTRYSSPLSQKEPKDEPVEVIEILDESEDEKPPVELLNDALISTSTVDGTPTNPPASNLHHGQRSTSNVDTQSRENDPDSTSSINSSDGLYRCHFCPARFSSALDVGTHILSHVPQFQNQNLGKSVQSPGVYVNNDKLGTSPEIVRSVNALECQLCRELFRGDVALGNHLSEIHGITTPGSSSARDHTIGISQPDQNCDSRKFPTSSVENHHVGEKRLAENSIDASHVPMKKKRKSNARKSEKITRKSNTDRYIISKDLMDHADKNNEDREQRDDMYDNAPTPQMVNAGDITTSLKLVDMLTQPSNEREAGPSQTRLNIPTVPSQSTVHDPVLSRCAREYSNGGVIEQRNIANTGNDSDTDNYDANSNIELNLDENQEPTSNELREITTLDKEHSVNSNTENNERTNFRDDDDVEDDVSDGEFDGMRKNDQGVELHDVGNAANNDVDMNIAPTSDETTSIQVMACAFCDKTFTKGKNLYRHYAIKHPDIHQLSEPSDSKRTSFCYTCGICGLKYTLRRNLKEHIERVHSDASEKDHRMLIQNDTNGINQSMLRCQYCYKSFGARYMYEHSYHEQTCEQRSIAITMKQEIKIEIENVETLSESAMAMEGQLSSQSQPSPRKPSTGGSKTTNDDNPETEIDSDLEDSRNRYICHICKNSFRDNYKLNRHSESSHSEAQYMCGACKLYFTDKADYTRHYANNCEPPSALRAAFTYNCDWCQTTFGEQRLYVSHVTTCNRRPVDTGSGNDSEDDTSYRSFKCRKCNSYFKDASKYRYHRNQGQCDADNQETNVDDVTAERSNVPPSNEKANPTPTINRYECDVCGMQCHSNYNLSKHSITSHGISKFQCSACCRYFTDQTEWNEHKSVTCIVVAQSIGSGSVPPDFNTQRTAAHFKCTLCGENCRDNFKLNRHSMRHHNKEQYMCVKCKTYFGRKTLYESHKRECRVIPEQILSKPHQQNEQETVLENHQPIESVPRKQQSIDNDSETRQKLDDAPPSGNVSDCEDVSKTSEKSERSHAHQIKSSRCVLCKGIFDDEQSYNLHASQCTVKIFMPSNIMQGSSNEINENSDDQSRNIQGLTCDICDTKFASKTMLSSHKSKAHTTSKRHGIKSKSSAVFGCSICNEQFDSSKKLKIHMSVTHKGTVLKEIETSSKVSQICSLCLKDFRLPTELAGHMITVHQWTIQSTTNENTGQTNQCSICLDTFDWQTDLSNHMLTVHDEVTFIGSNYVSHEQQDTTGHERTKQDTRKPKTKKNQKKSTTAVRGACKATFSACRDRKKTDTKKAEVGVNKSELPWEEAAVFTCHLCNYRTMIHSRLVYHLTMHSETKAHVCKGCNMPFITRRILREHKKKCNWYKKKKLEEKQKKKIYSGKQQDSSSTNQKASQTRREQCEMELENSVSGETNPDPSETVPDPSETNPDPSETNPDSSETNPDPSETNPDLSETNPDPSATNPDPSETNPDPSETDAKPQKVNFIQTKQESSEMQQKSDSQERGANWSDTTSDEDSEEADEEEETKFECDQCDKKYAHKYDLRRHKYCHLSEDKTFNCLNCNKYFLSRHFFQNHQLKCKPPGRHACTQCDKVYFKHKSLRSHIYLKHRLANITCDLCGNTFSHMHTLELHKRNIHFPKHQCDVCGKAFGSESRLQYHKARHAPPTLPCQYCGKLFTAKGGLATHVRDVHERQKGDVTCSECGAAFKSKATMRMHVQRKHNEDAQTFLCSICPYRTVSNHLLQEHVALKHSDERPFKCDRCPKDFKTKARLTKHQTSHSEYRPHVCTICSAAFKQQTHLTYHMLKHTGERAFKCTACGKAFQRKQILETHMLSHTGDRPFHCDHCGKDFLRKTDLNKHLVESSRCSTEESMKDEG